ARQRRCAAGIAGTRHAVFWDPGRPGARGRSRAPGGPGHPGGRTGGGAGRSAGLADSGSQASRDSRDGLSMSVEVEPLVQRPALAETPVVPATAPEGPGRPSMGLAQRLAILTAGLALLLVPGATEISLSWSARSRLEDF